MGQEELMKSNNYTLDYYNTKAKDFVSKTVDVAFTEIQDIFLEHVPAGGKILDFGCGSGRDTKYFLSKGYDVDAMDGSEELCRIAGEYVGIPVRQMLFEELDEVEEYDGIWACASILHVEKKQLPDIIKKIAVAVKKGGVVYISFKYGDFEGVRNGRFFTYLTEESFGEILKEIPELTIDKVWTSADVRAERTEEKWLNIVLRKQAKDLQRISEDRTEESYDEKMDVYYGGGYYGRSGFGRAGKEIRTDSRFVWGNEIWYVPAVYSCAKGLVIDFCVEIESQNFVKFMDKWWNPQMDEEMLSLKKREQMEKENPLSIEFTPHIILNDRELVTESGSSIAWIPENCLPEEMRNPQEAEQLIGYYKLDKTKVWSFHRWSFSWGKKNPTIKTLVLKQERCPVSFPGIRFLNPKAGDEITFLHPLSGKEYKLIVKNCEQNIINFDRKVLEDFEYPTHTVEMEYILSPELPQDKFFVTDCRQNDPPKQIQKDRQKNKYAASSIEIIGGADGPTAIFMAHQGKAKQSRIACSALTFVPQNEVEWKITFREKTMEDTNVCLINV